jgi:hypothetical protein
MMDKIYIVIINDRHEPPDAQPFTTQDAAVAYAKEYVVSETYGEREPEEKYYDDYLYYCTYSPEGDYVAVVARQVNPRLEDR